MIITALVKVGDFGFGQDFERAKEALAQARIPYKARTRSTREFGGRIDMLIFVPEEKADDAQHIIFGISPSAMSHLREPYFRRAKRRTLAWRRGGRLARTRVPLGSPLWLVQKKGFRQSAAIFPTKEEAQKHAEITLPNVPYRIVPISKAEAKKRIQQMEKRLRHEG